MEQRADYNVTPQETESETVRNLVDIAATRAQDDLAALVMMAKALAYTVKVITEQRDAVVEEVKRLRAELEAKK